jgi:hypothetical protein
VIWPSSLLPLIVGPGPVDDPGNPLIPPIEVDPTLVTPGVEGFIAIALVTVAAIFLLIDMTRRVRRVRYRGEVRDRLEAERVATVSDAATGRASGPVGSATEGGIDGDEENPRPVA